MTANYSIWPLSLDAAGSEKIDGPWQIIRILSALDASGDIKPDVLVEVAIGDTENDYFPLRLGMAAMNTGAESYRLRWEAQSGVTIVLGLSADRNAVDWDADPPVQLLSGALSLNPATGLKTTADVTLTAATTEVIIAANANRKSVSITNKTGAVLRIGDSETGASRGAEVPAGGSATLDVTAAVYGYSVPGGDVAVLETE